MIINQNQLHELNKCLCVIHSIPCEQAQVRVLCSLENSIFKTFCRCLEALFRCEKINTVAFPSTFNSHLAQILKPQKKALSQFMNIKTSQKRQKLKQLARGSRKRGGGIFTALISALVPLVIDLIGRAAKKKK